MDHLHCEVAGGSLPRLGPALLHGKCASCCLAVGALRASFALSVLRLANRKACSGQISTGVASWVSLCLVHCGYTVHRLSCPA